MDLQIERTSELPIGQPKLGVIRFAQDFGVKLDDILYLLNQTIVSSEKTNDSVQRRIQAFRSMHTMVVELTGQPRGQMKDSFIRIVLLLVPLHTWAMGAMVINRQLEFLSIDMERVEYSRLFDMIHTDPMFSACFLYVRLHTTEQLMALLNQPASNRTGALHIDNNERMTADIGLGTIATICNRHVESLPPMSQSWGVPYRNLTRLQFSVNQKMKVIRESCATYFTVDRVGQRGRVLQSPTGQNVYVDGLLLKHFSHLGDGRNAVG